ncbi:hypothetical protein GQ53DRAFT_822484 [Thozetella sp. PMI_491]|nr:hypothetical protein GQ53DRAFT_822484 [Thozetella sp. PMI_491]
MTGNVSLSPDDGQHPSAFHMQEHDKPERRVAKPLEGEDVLKPDLCPVSHSRSSHTAPQEAALTNGAKKHIYWGHPVLLLLFTISGVALALGHHLFYRSLDGTEATSTGQQWAVRLGTIFALLITSLFKAATAIALAQITWTTLRQRPFSLAVIDKIFSITSTPTALWSWELLRGAKLIVLLGIVTWCLPLAAFTPPATLFVVLEEQTFQNDRPVPILDWENPAWGQGNATIGGSLIPDGVTPSSLIRRIAIQSALAREILPLPAPATNSSYALQFFGPTLQCNEANSSQQPAFNNYTRNLASRGTYVIPELLNLGINGTNPIYFELVYSGLSAPFYDPSRPFDEELVQFPLPLAEILAPQIWIQTSNRSIVCVLVNASFDIGFDFSSGHQTITHRQPVQVLNEITFRMNCSGLTCMQISCFAGLFLAWSDILEGNVTLGATTDGWVFSEVSSDMLLTGLTACDEIENNGWNIPPYVNLLVFQDGIQPQFLKNLANNIFQRETQDCRNRTIDRGIEDLASNITISMLSSSNLTTSTLLTPVQFREMRNVYRYNSTDLLASYMTAVTVTLLTVSVGLYALSANGASHSNSFSTILRTTRNPDLDELSKGQNLGAAPLDQDMKKCKLRFGVIAVDTNQDASRQIAFGLEQKVSNISN